jgi:chromosome partitioning protein
MGQVISIIGNKGGTGKTTLSHMLGHGFGLFNRRAVAILTDTYRDKLSKFNRTYLPYDAREAVDLERCAAKLAGAPDWVGIIDGGGNRPEMDEQLAGMADLVLLPFRDSHEDIRTLIRDLERFPNAYALPSQWPTNRFAEASAQRSVNGMLGRYRTRILAPVYALSCSKLLLQDELPVLPNQLHNACREVAFQVMELLGMEVGDCAWIGRDELAQAHLGVPAALLQRSELALA